MVSPNKKEKLSSFSLVDQVYQQLRQDILDHQLCVGDRLPTEAELMKRFNVGRSTVREAIKILVNLGLIEVKQGRGTTVIKDTIPDQSLSMALNSSPVIEAYEARRVLETGIIVLACHNRNDDDLKLMNKYLKRRMLVAKNKSLNDYQEADQKFHRTITEAVHNSVVTNIYVDFCDTFESRFGKGFSKVAIFQQQTAIHENILAAIQQQKINKQV